MGVKREKVGMWVMVGIGGEYGLGEWLVVRSIRCYG